jgi:hypothetical protein
MNFGPLELEACGENNFTMKALGLLAFRQDLAARLVVKLFGEDVHQADEPVSILFFSRIGEGFFREAVQREQRDGEPTTLESRLNQALSLPSGFRWRRNTNGQLTQPAKWHDAHIQQMMSANGLADDSKLQARLEYLQDCLNTEPDIVLQWGTHLGIVEIKVLSNEGSQQIDRQLKLGGFLGSMLGWDCHLAFIGPSFGGRPSAAECAFFSWQEVAEWFADVSEISTYIRDFAFLYRGSWQSMISPHAQTPGETAYDLAMRGATRMQEQETVQPGPDLGRNVTIPLSAKAADPWHFSHLGQYYFNRLLHTCRQSGHIPIKFVWTGRTGEPYANLAHGSRINANWMVETSDGLRRTNGTRSEYNASRMHRWDFNEIAAHFHMKT